MAHLRFHVVRVYGDEPCLLQEICDSGPAEEGASKCRSAVPSPQDLILGPD